MSNDVNKIMHKQSRTMEVAIILPVFNTALYLEECLDSLLAQTYKHFTIFAVNDGSSDSSGEILEEYAKVDSRIVVINKTNGGVSSARNVALERISESNSFDLVCFTDSDDFVTPSFIETYVEYAIRHNADYIVCGWEPFNNLGTIHRKRLAKNIAPKEMDRDGTFLHAYSMGEWENVHASSASYFLANRCFAWRTIKNERFNESLKAGEDQDFLIRALINVSKGVAVNDINYMYRQRASSLTHVPLDPSIDLALFRSLTSQSQNFSTSIKEVLVQRANKVWWYSVCNVVKANAYSKYKRQLIEAYYKLKSFSAPMPLSVRTRKRFFMLMLGECFLKRYVKNRYRKTDDDSYLYE